jgi:hypothetical protein
VARGPGAGAARELELLFHTTEQTRTASDVAASLRASRNGSAQVVQLCTESRTRVREDSQSMDKQTCPLCNQPVNADQENTVSEDGQLAHTECSAKAGGESIYIPGNVN